MNISICIPTYEMKGEAKKMLARNFNALLKQTCKDFEVVISDNSENNVVKDLCLSPEYQFLNINYFRNPIKGMAQNTNEAMRHAKGEIIKILYMDDYLADEHATQAIKDNFRGYWMVTGCEHDNGHKRYNPHYPTYNKKIIAGKNTIGSPSVLSVRNEDILFFDENMTWLLDCDYYHRLYEKYGEPTILDEINVVIGVGDYQMTNIMPNILKKKERYYMAKKYKKRLLYWLGLW